MEYKDNVFAKIIRKEIPSTTLYEDDYTLAFKDINPQAPVHILVIPKGLFTDYSDFIAHATDEELIGFTRSVAKIVKEQNLDTDGYRLIFNTGKIGGQEVPHMHVHILAGTPLGDKLVNIGE